MNDLLERMRGYEESHDPDGWPAVRMRDISSLCSMVDALRAENEALALYQHLADQYGLSVFEDLTALRNDAERYRWLRNPENKPACVIDKRVDELPSGTGVWEYRAGEELDAAIDAALAADAAKAPPLQYNAKSASD